METLLTPNLWNIDGSEKAAPSHAVTLGDL